MGKKVIHIINDLRMGGVSSVLYNLLANASDSEYTYEVVNLSGFSDRSTKELFEEINVRIHDLDYVFEEGYSLKHYFRKAFLKRKYILKNRGIINYIVSLGADVLHFHTLPRELMLGQQVVDKCNLKLVYTDHTVRINPAELGFVSNALLKYPFRAFYKGYFVIAVSDAVGNYLRDQKIAPALKGLKVIANKIPATSVRISGYDASEPKFVYVSRIARGKGHADLIKAWSLLPALRFKLFIVGPDELNGDMEKLSSSLDCKNQIIFTGPQHGITEFLKGMDIGVFPSHKEGLPIALLEKMQVGLPCIASDIDEIRNVVEDNKTALLFECSNSEALKLKILELALNTDLKRKIGVAAAELVERKYSATNLRSEYEQVYRNLGV